MGLCHFRKGFLFLSFSVLFFLVGVLANFNPGIGILLMLLLLAAAAGGLECHQWICPASTSSPPPDLPQVTTTPDANRCAMDQPKPTLAELPMDRTNEPAMDRTTEPAVDRTTELNMDPELPTYEEAIGGHLPMYSILRC